MDVLYSRCCGLDVHKACVSACVLVREGTRTHKKYGRFAAMTEGLNELARWLDELPRNEPSLRWLESWRYCCIGCG